MLSDFRPKAFPPGVWSWLDKSSSDSTVQPHNHRPPALVASVRDLDVTRCECPLCT